MTWAEVCEDRFLNGLDWRIETDRWGSIVMSPPPRSEHGEYQSAIAQLLARHLEGGVTITECPLETSEGTKAIDVAWVSRHRRASRRNRPAYVIAPEICVEIVSPSNTDEQIDQRKKLYFEKGAVEFWVCNLQGKMSFFDAAGPIPKSALCPRVPSKVRI